MTAANPHRCEALDEGSSGGVVRCRRRATIRTILWADLGFWVRAWVCERHQP